MTLCQTLSDMPPLEDITNDDKLVDLYIIVYI